jgi:hypothetical protein
MKVLPSDQVDANERTPPLSLSLSLSLSLFLSLSLSLSLLPSPSPSPLSTIAPLLVRVDLDVQKNYHCSFVALSFLQVAIGLFIFFLFLSQVTAIHHYMSAEQSNGKKRTK